MIFLFLLSLGLWAFIIYINWFASPAELYFIGTSGIDKVAHIAGGVFIAAFWEWKIRRAHLAAFLLAIGAVALGWEVVEFFFDDETRFFYETYSRLWLLDSIGDVLAAFLGGYSWRVLQ